MKFKTFKTGGSQKSINMDHVAMIDGGAENARITLTSGHVIKVDTPYREVAKEAGIEVFDEPIAVSAPKTSDAKESLAVDDEREKAGVKDDGLSGPPEHVEEAKRDKSGFFGKKKS